MNDQFNNPELKNFGDLAGMPGQCFYIPPYQRPFAWKKKNIHRFLEDAVSGIKCICALDDDAVTFIGSMTFYHDIRYSSIEPKVRSEMPPRVYNIVDGQQRLTVLATISAVIHDFLRVRGKCIGEGLLREKCEEYLPTLFRTIEHDAVTGERQFYPRIIRAYIDQWSKRKEHCRYDSPLARFISEYGKHVRRDDSNNLYSYDAAHSLPQVTQAERELYRNFDDLLRETGRLVRRICENNPRTPDEMMMPPITDLSENSTILQALFRLEQVESSDFDPNDPKQAEVFRALLLAYYILDRIKFISLVTTKEDYAFDIFDSLNTTGMSLTAIETFKPEVVRFEKMENFSNSESKRHFDSIDQYMEKISGENQKAKVSSGIVTNFALAEDGTTLSAHLGVQRLHLRRNYEHLESPGDKRRFTHHLMCVSQVAQFFGENGGDDLHLIPEYSEIASFEDWKQVHFCLKYLRGTRHTIARSVIARFHHIVMNSTNIGKKEKHIKELLCTVKAIAAFFALWRASRQHTDGIDNRYRKLLKDGYGQNGGNAFCRKSGNTPSVDILRQAFVHLLSEDGGNSDCRITNCKAFSQCSKAVPIYRTQKETAKFLLLVSAHDALASSSNPGILEKGTPGVRPMIVPENWEALESASIEHLIPVSHGESIERDVVDSLGNLTLLPKHDNAILSNRSWEERQQIYAIQSATTEEQRNALIDSANFLRKDAREYFRNKPQYLPLTQAAARCESFDADMIERRGKNIAELAWDILAGEWLGFPADI